ncbi:MAG: hypothetical protein D4R44_04275 [Actinobacteria bacterium]|nr:MAG: hypothetical protein D4R44_04275 [Actinomycetota bacterium]
MESLARLVVIILGTALASLIIAIVLWRKPPRNTIARVLFCVLMIPVICIGVFLATLSVGIGIRALGVAIIVAAALAIKAMLTKK